MFIERRHALVTKAPEGRHVRLKTGGGIRRGWVPQPIGRGNLAPTIASYHIVIPQAVHWSAVVLSQPVPVMGIVPASLAMRMKAPPPVMGISPGSPALPTSLNSPLSVRMITAMLPPIPWSVNRSLTRVSLGSRNGSPTRLRPGVRVMALIPLSPSASPAR